MSCRRRGRHRGRRGRRHDRERVFATVNNDFERERGDNGGGDVENLQQAGNALALEHSQNNKVEQENKFKSEED